MKEDGFYCKFQKVFLPEQVSLAASDISDSGIKFLNFLEVLNSTSQFVIITRNQLM